MVEVDNKPYRYEMPENIENNKQEPRPTLKARIRSVIERYEMARQGRPITSDEREQMALEVASIVLSWNDEKLYVPKECLVEGWRFREIGCAKCPMHEQCTYEGKEAKKAVVIQTTTWLSERRRQK